MRAHLHGEGVLCGGPVDVLLAPPEEDDRPPVHLQVPAPLSSVGRYIIFHYVPVTRGTVYLRTDVKYLLLRTGLEL